jgi:hypothetical protein
LFTLSLTLFPAPLPFRGAALPILPLPVTAFAPRAPRGVGPREVRCLGPGDLLPPRLGIEFLRVAATENFECGLRVVLEVDRSLRMLVREPIRRRMPKPAWRRRDGQRIIRAEWPDRGYCLIKSETNTLPFVSGLTSKAVNCDAIALLAQALSALGIDPQKQG